MADNDADDTRPTKSRKSRTKDPATLKSRDEQRLDNNINAIEDMLKRIETHVSALRHGNSQDAGKPSEVQRLLDRVGDKYRDARDNVHSIQKHAAAARTIDAQRIMQYVVEQDSGNNLINDQVIDRAMELIASGADAKDVLNALGQSPRSQSERHETDL